MPNNNDIWYKSNHDTVEFCWLELHPQVPKNVSIKCHKKSWYDSGEEAVFDLEKNPFKIPSFEWKSIIKMGIQNWWSPFF